MVSENDANQTCPLEPNSCAEFSRHKSHPLDEWEVVMSSFTKPDRAFEPLGRPI